MLLYGFKAQQLPLLDIQLPTTKDEAN